MTDAENEGPRREAVRGAGARMVVWLRRIGLALLAVILAITAVSLVFNWVTDPPDRLDPGFGSYVRVGDADVHYKQWGTHGSPVVLVPGAFESSVVWTAVGPLLGKDHRVYALDMPWHGYTHYSGSMKLDAQARLVSGFVGALHLSKPLLVGHSMGAAVVASVALTHPNDMGGVVFADGDALPIPVATGVGRVVLHAVATHTPYLTSVLRLAARWPSQAQSMIKSLCGDPCPGLTPDLAREWVRPFGQQDEVDAIHAWLGGDGYGLSPDQLAQIAVPTEIIWGDNDHEGGSLTGAIANLGHPPVYTIKDAGHLSMLADPVRFAAAVEAAATSR